MDKITQPVEPKPLSKKEIEQLIELKLQPIKKELEEVKNEVNRLRTSLKTTESIVNRMGRNLRNSNIK
jgi:phage-related minor tail protein